MNVTCKEGLKSKTVSHITKASLYFVYPLYIFFIMIAL